jgi:sugar phosphate isomerase/epimerase
MRLGLSSAAAPDAFFDELLAACLRSGMTGLELEAGHAHGIDVLLASPELAAAARARAASAGVTIAAFRPEDARSARLPALALALGAPVLVPCDGAAAIAAKMPAGVEVLAVLPANGDPLAALDDLDTASPGGGALSLAWDADPAAGYLASSAAALLERAGRRLRHVRLSGGGPESSMQEGRGVGALMARLALAGFDGTVALAPSSDRYRVVWAAWLGRRSGWGCGSQAEERALVTLGTP